MTTNTTDTLRKALEVARQYVKLQNRAEGIFEGVNGRQPRVSDADLQMIDEAIASCQQAQELQPAEQEKPYGFDDFIREAKEKNLTIHDILPQFVKRCAELEAEQQAPAITEQAPPLPTPYPVMVIVDEYGSGSEVYTADQLRERDAMWMVKITTLSTPPAVPHEPWVPYLVDRADGCKGRYAIARWHPDGYREVWNLRSHRWASASDDVLTLEQARELMRNLVIPTALSAAPAAPGEPCAPHILEALSYHGRERDDLTLEEAVEAFRHGYKKVRQREDRAMLAQIIDLLASAPAAPQGEQPE